MCERVDGKAGARETPIGMMPLAKDLDLSGLEMMPKDLEKILSVNTEAWSTEVEDIEAFFQKFGDHYTDRLKKQLEGLKKRLGKQ
jgi:phosphoenolpyruvate carboxykinase (GTP)